VARPDPQVVPKLAGGRRIAQRSARIEHMKETMAMKECDLQEL
jgi:hypothetical protein